MINPKCSLVLEGGGMRGAYTAGALTWLLDNGIDIENCYGISTGAVHLCNFMTRDKENLLYFSTVGIADKRYIGLPALLRCGKFVDYDYLFNYIMTEERKYDLSPLKESKVRGIFGLYKLSSGKTEYYSLNDATINHLKASTTLPVLGKVVNIDGEEYFDGGITDMIPIEEAVRDGNEKFVIITTKPEDYVRKPSSSFVVNLMKIMYKQCPQLSKDYAVRHENYYKQINLINSLVEKGDAIYCFPTRHSDVTRLGGSIEELKALFDMGYEDMEERRDAILRIVNV